MHIVWLSWKDRGHPQAGGAEVVSGKIMDQLALEGHKVTLITARYLGSKANETLSGIRVFRRGGRFSVYIRARKMFKSLRSENIDIVIDEMNTMPFGSGFYSDKVNVLLTYQLARKVWFYQMIFPLSVAGYFLEPLYLRLIAKRYHSVLTESESTKHDLIKYGFRESLIKVFRVSIEPKPLQKLPAKSSQTVLSLGAIRPMKRTLEAVKAFEVARDSNPALTLVLAGDDRGTYGDRVKRYVSKSRHSHSITVRGRVSAAERISLMANSAVILVTSVKEGWGLIVTEANSQGTPAIVYDVDGLRDSVRHGVSGIVCPDGDFIAMGSQINDLLGDNDVYENIRFKAWEWSKEFTFDNSFRDFMAALPINTKDDELI